MTTKTLKQLCDDIAKCYDDGLTMFDSPLQEYIEELSTNWIDEIRELIARNQEMLRLLREVQCIIKQTGPEYCEEHDLPHLSGADVVQCLCEQVEARIDKVLA